MLNNLLLFIYNLYFKWFKINENQSLIYQIMITIMHIHKMKRFGIFKEIQYIGTDSLVISEDEFEIVGNRIKSFLTYNNKDLVNKSGINPLLIIAFEGSAKKSPYYEIKKQILNDKKTIIFSMTNDGYSYQYNGYKKSEVRLQDKANLFAMIAIFGTSFSWLVDKEFINYKSYTSLTKAGIIYFGIASVYFFRKKRLTYLFWIVVTFFIVYFLYDYLFF